MIVSLAEITDANRDDILRLAVAPEQIDLVDSVALSLDEAAGKPDAHPWFRAISLLRALRVPPHRRHARPRARLRPAAALTRPTRPPAVRHTHHGPQPGP